MSGPAATDDGFARLGDLIGDPGPQPETAPARPQLGGAATPTHETGSAVKRAGPASPRGQGARRGPLPDVARRVAEVWADAVGPDIAANAQPVQLKQGRLVVSTSSSAWAQSLQFMGEAVRVRLNESLGTDEIRTIFFRHAGWEAAMDQQPGSTVAGPRRSRRPGASGASGTGSAQTLPAAPVLGDAESESTDSMVGAVEATRPRPADHDPTADDEPVELTREERTALESVRDLQVSPELRELIARAMKAAFVREGR